MLKFQIVSDCLWGLGGAGSGRPESDMKVGVGGGAPHVIAKSVSKNELFLGDFSFHHLLQIHELMGH